MPKPHIYFNRFETRQTVVIAIVGGALVLDELTDRSRVHNFAGVVFYSDAEGTTAVQPSAGTATFTVRLVVQPQAFQSFPRNVIDDLSVPCQVNLAANTEEVRATLAGIVGATHARLIWAGNSA